MSEQHYVSHLEAALTAAGQRIVDLKAENVRLRSVALGQVDLSLGLVCRYADTITNLQADKEDLQTLVDFTVERNLQA